jgi:hypothetical protein
MYADTSVIRAMATSMRERADDLRADADGLARHVEAVPWTGLAADAMRRAAGSRVADLRSCAQAHDTAAEGLDRHALEVDRVEDLIASIERRAHHLLESAAGALSGLVGGVVHLPRWA